MTIDPIRPLRDPPSGGWIGAPVLAVGYGEHRYVGASADTNERQAKTGVLGLQTPDDGTLQFTPDAIMVQPSWIASTTPWNDITHGDSGGPTLYRASSTAPYGVVSVASWGALASGFGNRLTRLGDAQNWATLLRMADPGNLCGGGNCVGVPLLGDAETGLSAADDPDSDGVATFRNGRDNCPVDANPNQLDTDLDGIGDICDALPLVPDSDGDGRPDIDVPEQPPRDLCPFTTETEGDDPLGDDPFHPRTQRNCNANRERIRRGDACDPYPCNTLDAVANLSTPQTLRITATNDPNGPTPGSRRARYCVPGLTPGARVCNLQGPQSIELGFAPRRGVGGADYQVTPSPNQPLVSPVYRCFCLQSISGNIEKISPGQCAINTNSPCAVSQTTQNPLSLGGGLGWSPVPISIPTTFAGTTGNIFDTSPTQVAAALSYPSSTEVTYSSAVDLWRSTGGRDTWSWNNWWINTPTNPVPGTMPYATRVVFWNRAQPLIAPANEPQRNAQRLQDHIPRDEWVTFVPENITTYVPPIMDHWWDVDVRWRIPPCPLDLTLPYNTVVSRERAGIFLLRAGDAQTLGSQFWAQSTTGALRGVVVGLLDVRRSLIGATALSVGAKYNVPEFESAAWAVGPNDEQGWPTVYSFGGRDTQGLDVGRLFMGTPAHAPDGTTTYQWQSLSSSGPSPRRDVALGVGESGTRIYVAAGRKVTSGVTTTFSDVWVFDRSAATWSVLVPASNIPARYDAGIAIRGEYIYLGGGIGATGNALGDLIRIDGMSGALVNYGSVLPTGGLPYLGFDDHGEGLVYGGGYVGTTWYRDLWKIRLSGNLAWTSFLFDFGASGMPATRNYALVPDIEHRVFWAIPGQSLGTSPQGVWQLRGGAATAIVPGQGNGAFARSSSAMTTGAASTSPTTRSPDRQTVSASAATRAAPIPPGGERGGP